MKFSHSLTMASIVSSVLLTLSSTALVFPLSAQTLTILQEFVGSDGAQPASGLVDGRDGRFYGTTQHGGASGNGTIYSVTSAGEFASLYSFSGAEGALPYGALTLANDGNFYGTTIFGNSTSGNFGTIYRLTPTGQFTTIYTFAGADGANPKAPLVQGADGSLYGTAEAGGEGDCQGSTSTPGCGTVFRIAPGGRNLTLYRFKGEDDGGRPIAGLVRGSDGNFYGTTLRSEGPCDCGTVYRISPHGNFTLLHTFTGGIDGAFPTGELVQAPDGSLYGVTSTGGASGFGTVFRLSKRGKLTTVYAFTGGFEGGNPTAGLTRGKDGYFYGSTGIGGSNNAGTIYRITPKGVLSVLYMFAFNSAAGGSTLPSRLIQDDKGDLYGATFFGDQPCSFSPAGCGTVFRLTPATVGFEVAGHSEVGGKTAREKNKVLDKFR